LAVWCLEKQNISLYLDKKEIKKLKDYKEFLKGCWLIIKVIKIYAGAKRFKNAVISPIERWNSLRTQGLVQQFQLQAGEKIAIKHSVQESSVFLTQVLAIITVAYTIFAFTRK